ncbi:hypothetical protein B0T13DRAFT_444169 [Neurospora crassa]|nr:hypothetical protein B0T13DRAFT_444169 [Neurospora crassa]
MACSFGKKTGDKGRRGQGCMYPSKTGQKEPYDEAKTLASRILKVKALMAKWPEKKSHQFWAAQGKGLSEKASKPFSVRSVYGRWWSKLKNWMLKRMLRGSRMVRLRPNPAKQAPVSQHRKCKTRTDMATRVHDEFVRSALEAGGCSGRVSSGLAEACRAEIEEDMIWSKDYASVESGLAVSLRSEQGGSGVVEGKQGRRAKIASSKIKGRMIRVTRVLILLGLPDRSRQVGSTVSFSIPSRGLGNPRLANCRLWMRGFGDDCDSLAGLMVLSHKPTLERLLKRERMTESRERNKEIVCGLHSMSSPAWPDVTIGTFLGTHQKRRVHLNRLQTSCLRCVEKLFGSHVRDK